MSHFPPAIALIAIGVFSLVFNRGGTMGFIGGLVLGLGIGTLLFGKQR